MSILDDQIDDYLDTLGFFDEEEDDYFDDSFIIAQRQKPKTETGVDFRFEKGGIYYND